MTTLNDVQKVLYNDYLNLAESLAMENAETAIDLETLPRIARKALEKAVLKFEQTAETDFEYFATKVINREIRWAMEGSGSRIFNLEGFDNDDEDDYYESGEDFTEAEFERALSDAGFNYNP